MTIDNTKYILCGGNSVQLKFLLCLKDENLFGLKTKI